MYTHDSQQVSHNMNLKQANESLNPLGLRVTVSDGEYRVAFIYGWHGIFDPETSAYYTDDIEDAEATGVEMYNQAKVN